MSVVLTIPRTSRLSSMINAPGGISVGVALTQAGDNVQALQARGMAIVGEQVAALMALVPPEPGGPEALGRRVTAYELASAVIDAAHPFQRDDLCAAASSLCDLVDAAPDDRPFDWRIVTVHAQAMQLILALPPEAGDARRQILDSLAQVVAHKIPGASTD